MRGRERPRGGPPPGGSAAATTRTPGGLIRRTGLANALLAVVISGAFAVLLLAIRDIRSDESRALRAQDVLIAANTLERLLLDLETGQRGYIITGQQQFLEPWQQARDRFPQQAAKLLRLGGGDAATSVQIRDIVHDMRSYIADYSLPLVQAARRGDVAAKSDAVTAAGKARVDAIRSQFDRLLGTEQQDSIAGADASEAAARRAYIGAAIGIIASLALVVLHAAYLMRVIVGPVRRAATMAGRLAGGDLAARLPETGSGEIGGLQQSFNVMADSLQHSRDQLAMLAEEQAALRRVATRVARGEKPRAVFAAVAEEIGQLFPADLAVIRRYDADRTATCVGAWTPDGDPGLVGTKTTLGGRNVITKVFETHRPARLDSGADSTRYAAVGANSTRIGSAVAVPIVVQDHLWGAIMAAARPGRVLDPGAEQRLAEFTELVATAIANAEAQAELTASRARIVATADQTRRRIERDLHDGAQQRLVALALQLRAVREEVPGELGGLANELDDVVDGLTGALDELREYARGIHPPILAEGGLGPALRALGRSAAVPVELRMPSAGRLPEHVEVAAYYIVSESLTNAAKHARASLLVVEVEVDDMLHLCVRDDGVGGATFAGGTGLVGLRDRVDALGGRIRLDSRAGVGTSLYVDLPLEQNGSPPPPR
jgi:signal transduction histidine kinase